MYIDYFETKSIKKAAFTLAEVLITLGIIGVVAAITIPVLVNKFQDEQYKTAYKKAYSNLSQALQRANTDNVLEPATGAYDPIILDNFVKIMSYLNIQKTCYGYLTEGTSANNSACWFQNGEEFNSSSFGNGFPANDDLVAIDISGTSYAIYALGYTFMIIVDTNGLKKPNQMGKDRFAIHLRSQAGSNQIGIPVKILPDNDNTAQSTNQYPCNYNKCATEKNYYATSWLMNQN